MKFCKPLIITLFFIFILNGCTGGQWRCREYRTHWFEDPPDKKYTREEQLLEPYKTPRHFMHCGWEADGYPYSPYKKLNHTHWRWETKESGM